MMNDECRIGRDDEGDFARSKGGSGRSEWVERLFGVGDHDRARRRSPSGQRQRAAERERNVEDRKLRGGAALEVQDERTCLLAGAVRGAAVAAEVVAVVALLVQLDFPVAAAQPVVGRIERVRTIHRHLAAVAAPAAVAVALGRIGAVHGDFGQVGEPVAVGVRPRWIRALRVDLRAVR
jgi:hypothetical protein